MTTVQAPKKKKFYQIMYFQVLTAIIIGILLGWLKPDLAAQMKPLGDLFIKLIKMVIAPIIFCTVVVGIGSIGDMKKVGRVGIKALIYFEVVTTLALIIGVTVANLYHPGSGIDVTKFKGDISTYVTAAKNQSTWDFILKIVPDQVMDAFAKGEILQVLFFSILFGTVLAGAGEKGKSVVEFFDKIGHAMFGVVGIVMKAAPVGAFGAMSYTIGKFGVKALIPLAKLMASVYTTMFLFIFVVLALICKFYGFSIFKYLNYIKEEIFIVLGTSSSESVLPRMIDKMEKFGASKSVVGLVIPTGYSFNLDGTSI
ncbi:MAG TPA: cation:dicarboxylase symporter family transporter, partial [Candidatus Deferrimicrobium sp.]|nr:cation:dicarboxylase symporter family transporter [Candidatus Deferrimicrobium sp.]